MLDEQQRNRVFNIIIITQCLGMVVPALFQNGFFLNYFTKLGISSAAIAMLFALSPLSSIFLLLPFAFYSDRFGKRQLALVGQILLVASLGLMMLAGWGFDTRTALLLVVMSLVVSSVGGSLQAAGWFALLNPIVPKEIRGRFFGRLRVSFQLAAILFTLLITRMLKVSEAMTTFQLLLGIVFLATLLRYFTYARIPELENAGGEENHRDPFQKALAKVLAEPGYLHFNSYVFLFTLFTSAVPIVFGLMQKDAFEFTPAQITRVGTLFLTGSMLGCWVGGRAVDRYGSRMVFVIAHLAFAASMFALLARHWVPWSLFAHVGGCSLAFSLVGGMAGVAITTETLALIPAANKSLSTAFTMTLSNASIALAGMGVSRVIGWSILSPGWQMLGQKYTAYDSLVLFFAAMMLLMLVAIGLVPSITPKSSIAEK